MSNGYEKWGFSTIAHSTGMTTTVTSTAVFSYPSTAPAPQPVTVPPVTKMFPLTVDLPEGYLRWIGKVMVLWSLQEWLLQHILFPLVTPDEAVARISVGTPRSYNVAERIEQICKTKGIMIRIDMGKLKQELTRLEKIRDQIGHGAWIIDDFGRYCAVVYSGNWEAGEYQGTPKRVTPHAMPIDEAFLTKVVDDIKATIEITKILAVEAGVARRA